MTHSDKKLPEEMSQTNQNDQAPNEDDLNESSDSPNSSDLSSEDNSILLRSYTSYSPADLTFDTNPMHRSKRCCLGCVRVISLALLIVGAFLLVNHSIVINKRNYRNPITGSSFAGYKRPPVLRGASPLGLATPEGSRMGLTDLFNFLIRRKLSSDTPKLSSQATSNSPTDWWKLYTTDCCRLRTNSSFGLSLSDCGADGTCRKYLDNWLVDFSQSFDQSNVTSKCCYQYRPIGTAKYTTYCSVSCLNTWRPINA